MDSDNEYIHLTFNNLLVQVKFEHEGVVVDLYELDIVNGDELLTTTYAFYEDLPVDLKRS